MKRVDVKANTYIDFNKENQTRIKLWSWWSGNNIKIQNIFAKCYFPNWSEEVFMIKNVKNTVLDTDML